jgi:molybdopterin molybdotransferase
VILFDEALAAVLQEVLPLPAEQVPLTSALGRVLAHPLAAGADGPRFDNSSVDGYAVRVMDLAAASPDSPVRLPVSGILPAGSEAVSGLAPGTTVRIMTGAPVPPGTEACVMREEVLEGGEWAEFRGPARTGDNIRRRGGEYRAGEVLLPDGTLVTPPVLALLASLGMAGVEVHRQPRVRLLVTGSEVVAPGSPLAPGQIYDANGAGLESALRALGVTDVTVTRFGDREAEIGAWLRLALEEADVVLTSGGVSAGDFDYVPSVFESLGGHRRFWKVAIKPGKPNYFGVRDRGASRALFFGLPGNPVGALLSFERLVRPAMLKLGGRGEVAPRRLEATLGAPLEKSPGRLEWVRGVLGQGHGGLTVMPLPQRDSHMLTGLARADCLIRFPEGARRLDPGERVEVQLLRWGP